MKTELRQQIFDRRSANAIVQFHRRPARKPSIVQRLWQRLQAFSASSSEPRIRETIDASGNPQWTVYDPIRHCRLEFDSEQAVLEWLEEQHTFTPSSCWN